MNFAEKIPEKQQDILTVALKDLEQIKSPDIDKQQKGALSKKLSSEEGDEVADSQREQYRIVKKDLLFQVNFTSQHNKYMGDENTQTERTLSDFRKLGNSL